MDQDDKIIDQLPDEAKKRVWLIRLLALLLIASLLFFLVYGALRISGLPSIKQLRHSARLAQEETIALAAPSAVTVIAGNQRGSGFILPAADLCLTCAHVLGQEKKVMVQVGKRKLAAEILLLDPALDLALLRLAEKVDPGLELANFLPQPQEELIMIGSPFGSGRLISQMKYLGPVKTVAYPLPLLAVAGPVYQGNSGSPLLNQAGLVVGVLSASGQAADPEDGTLGLVIPFDLIKEFMADYKEELSAGPGGS